MAALSAVFLFFLVVNVFAEPVEEEILQKPGTQDLELWAELAWSALIATTGSGCTPKNILGIGGSSIKAIDNSGRIVNIKFLARVPMDPLPVMCDAEILDRPHPKSPLVSEVSCIKQFNRPLDE